MKEFSLTGGCLCGGAGFELTEPPVGASYCHCGRCGNDPGVRAAHRPYLAYAAAWEPLPDDGLPRFPEAARPAP
jgi:hypothetical protein